MVSLDSFSNHSELCDGALISGFANCAVGIGGAGISGVGINAVGIGAVVLIAEALGKSLLGLSALEPIY